MAVRIPITPDKDGIIRLTCEGQELEIQISAGGATKPPAGPGKPPAKPKQAGGPAEIDWSKVLGPGSKPRVTFVPIGDKDDVIDGLSRDDPDASLGRLKPLVFTTKEAVNFHELIDLGGKMETNGMRGRFGIAFGKQGGSRRKGPLGG